MIRSVDLVASHCRSKGNSGPGVGDISKSIPIRGDPYSLFPLVVMLSGTMVELSLCFSINRSLLHGMPGFYMRGYRCLQWLPGEEEF